MWDGNIYELKMDCYSYFSSACWFLVLQVNVWSQISCQLSKFLVAKQALHSISHWLTLWQTDSQIALCLLLNPFGYLKMLEEAWTLDKVFLVGMPDMFTLHFSTKKLYQIKNMTCLHFLKTRICWRLSR